MASSDLSSLVAAQRSARSDDFQGSRARWRAIADCLSAGQQDVPPIEILAVVLAALASPRNDSLPAVRCTASALKALHALLLSKSAAGASADGGDTLWLRLSQPQLKDCVDALLITACLYAPRRAAGGPTNNALSRSASHTSLASMQSLSIRSEDDGGGGTTTDYASDARSTTTVNDAASRLNASCRSVRLNSLSCLSALNETRPALFFSQWARLVLAEHSAPSMPPGLGMRTSRSAMPGSSNSSASGSVLTLIKSDPVLGVRIAAASLVEAMFRKAAQGRFLASGVVEERSAFTSLAARMGSLVASVRGSLVDVIDMPARRSSMAVAGPLQASRTPSTAPGAPAAPAPLIEAVLRALKALVLATPTAKLRRPHLDVLQGPLLRLSSHAEPSVAIAAYVVLSTLSPSGSVGGGSGSDARIAASASPAASPVAGIISRLLASDAPSSSSSLDGEALAQAWSALAGFLPTRYAEVLEAEAGREDQLLARLEVHAAHTEQAVRQACIAFVGAALEGKVAAASVGLLSSYANIVKRAASDPSPLVRIEVAQALPALLRLEAAAAPAARETTYNEPHTSLPPSASILSALLLDAAGGGEASVQSAAVRAVGVLFSLSSPDLAEPSPTSSIPPLNLTALLPLAMEEALCPSLLRSPALLVRLRAAWTLANVCQALAESRATPTQAAELALDAAYPDLWSRLLGMTHNLLADDERVASNATRAAGLLFSAARGNELYKAGVQAEARSSSSPRSSLDVISAILERCSTAHSPKLKWNAVNALAAASSNSIVRTVCADTPAGEEELGTTTTLASLLTQHLTQSLTTSRIFKVRLAAIAALRRLSTPLEFGGAQSARIVLEKVAEARGKVEADVAEATFREAQLHGQALKDGLKGLEDHVRGVLERGA